MTDLFADKAAEWDQRPLPVRISEGVSAALFARVDLSGDATVLDFGAGTGLLTGHVASRVASVVAVDVSPAMLEQLAAKTALHGKVEAVCQDLLVRPLGRRVQCVVSAMAMHHVEDTAALLRTLLAHLEPGGQVALADLDREDGDFHPAGAEGVFHHGFDRGDLSDLMRTSGFVDVGIETACEIDKEGKRYSIFLATGVRPAEVA
jgi:cyclopropane fatty-acyl-phospholipid synthase-like methyltransferase